MKYINLVVCMMLIMLVSCSTPEEKAQKELNARGVPVLVSAFMDQAKQGSGENIKLLLEAGMPVNSVDEDGNTALHLAAEGGHVEVINILLSAGIDTDKKDKNGNTPLIRAVKAEKMKAAVTLVKAGVNTQAVNELGKSALSLALENKNWPMVIALGNAGITIDVIVEDGRTLLMDSIIHKRGVEIAKTLIEAGADINRADNGGQTPFMAAVEKNQPALVALMLKKGTNVNAPLFDNKSMPALLQAIEEKSPALASVLVEGGADVNCKNQETNNSCLHRAVMLQQKEIVGILIKGGADVNAQNIFYETPLYMATVNPPGKNLEIAEMLIAAGAEMNKIVTENGRTLLHVAALQSDKLADSLIFLLKKGADPNVYDNDGQTPLTLAILNNKPEAVDALVKGGADPNYPAMTGKKPLAIAEELDHYKIVSKLKLAGAKEN